MYEYWRTHQNRRNGLGPTPTELSKACGTSYQSAKEAVTRYRRGRIPTEYQAGLSPKSVRNVHRLIHRAFSDAVAWDYVVFNPAEHARLPRERHRGRATPQPWSLEELGQWLRLARRDRFAGMWVLAFTVGALRRHLEMLDGEREAFGTAYPEGGWLFVWEDGSRPHPDTVTDRFNRLVDAAGARRIRLHDVRHRAMRPPAGWRGSIPRR